MNKKIETDLFSAHPETVIAALNSLKEEGNIFHLPLLFDLLNSRSEQIIEDQIVKILGSLKVRDSVPVLVNALTEPKYKAIRKTLATACWQNGLDYKEYLPVFVDLVIHEDWETGFEAFTVIENMEHYPGKEIKEQAIEQIHAALNNADEQKKYFLHEILTLIR
jgi:hypothetical protein